MKTSEMAVQDMLSVLSPQGVEERIGEVPGVESVTVNHSAGTATVRYDETRLDVAEIKSSVRQRGAGDRTAASNTLSLKASTAPPGSAGTAQAAKTAPDGKPAPDATTSVVASPEPAGDRTKAPAP